MTTNEEYKSLFADTSLGGFRGRYDAIRKAAEAEWAAAILAEQKRRQPRKRSNFDSLDDAFRDALRETLHTKYDVKALDAEKARLSQARDDRMWELAPLVTPEKAAVQVVDSCSTSTYRSQTQPHKYAEKSLEPLRVKLIAMGFACEVRFRKVADAPTGPNSWGVGELGDYELWADCEPWLADAAAKTVTPQQTFAALTLAGVNVRVYHPFAGAEIIYQVEAKIRKARENKVADDAYFALPFAEWAAIRDAS